MLILQIALGILIGNIAYDMWNDIMFHLGDGDFDDDDFDEEE